MLKTVTIKSPKYKLLEKNCIHRLTINKSFRIYRDEYKEILDTCEKLGISFNYFIRYCAVMIARSINNDEK